jgi:hypothetical protein
MSEAHGKTIESIPCPDCDGKGEQYCHVNRGGPGNGFGWFPCLTCKGRRVVPADYPERREAGRRMREDRLSRNMTLRDEAARLGISVVELSRLEQGRTWGAS